MNKQKENIYSEFPKLKKISEDKFPKHVLIIPDGNGRWAKRFQKLPSFGHKKGYRVLQSVIRNLQELPINIVTIWAFSSNNWKRNSDEIESLMQIYDEAIKEALIELNEKNMRFIHIGRRDRIPKFLLKTIENTEKVTINNGPKIFCIAIDYSGLDQEIRMMEKVLKLPKNTKIDLNLIKSLRDGQGEIDPADLIIRTSGENRVSDLGWIVENSEFYTINKMLPETRTEDFVEALVEFSKRERRFGARIS